MLLKNYIDLMLPEIEQEIKATMENARGEGLEDLYSMLAYHLGWQSGNNIKSQGKRIRPLLVLLSTSAAGGDWKKALPAGAAVELVHNFSLIHDDIQDKSPTRRGRETLWKMWDVPLAINAGDSMFALAHIALKRLNGKISPATLIKAYEILPMASLELTQGQYLDLIYEDRDDIRVQDYWPMIERKTASLIASCTKLGAIVAEIEDDLVAKYRQFGLYIGQAFQVVDDMLGIWGNSDKTGKSVASDLLERKKSLPILYGLELNGDFASLWREQNTDKENVEKMSQALKIEGGLDYAQDVADKLTQKAMDTLRSTNPEPQAGGALLNLAANLINRNS